MGTTGMMPTFQGYFVQGWFKFGGVEICKTKFAQAMGSERAAWKNRDAITLGGSACAEFVADIFLCPYEAVRIRSVSDPSYASGMAATGKKMISEMGVVNALYSGFGPMLFKQIPYTMAKFSVQQKAAEMIYGSLGTSPDKMSKGGVITVSLASGVNAGAVGAHRKRDRLCKVVHAGPFCEVDPCGSHHCGPVCHCRRLYDGCRCPKVPFPQPR